MRTGNENLSHLLTEAIQNNAFDQALLTVENLRPIDLADALASLDIDLSWRLLERLPNRAEVFSYFEAEQQVELAQELPRKTLVALVREMPADKRTDLFKRFDQSQRDRLLPSLAPAEREDIYKLASYEEGTAGALMTSDYVQLKKDMTVAEAIAYLRDESLGAETIYQVFVTNKQGKLRGAVSLRDLISADLDARVKDLMVRDLVSLRQQKIKKTSLK